MNKKILIIIGILVILVIAVLFYMDPKNSKFDFQILLPNESVFNFENLDDLEVIAEVASSIWFEDAKEVEISPLEGEKYEIVGIFLSESKPFGLISVSGSQETEDGSSVYLDMSSYVFYKPFIEENLTKQERRAIKPYVWEKEGNFIIGSHSTAVAYLINNYLVSSVTNSPENPFVYSMPSSEDLLSDLPELLDDSKFTEFQDKVNSFLSTGNNSPFSAWMETEISDLALDIIGADEDYIPTEKDSKNLPQAKDAEITSQLSQKLWKLAVELDDFSNFNMANDETKLIANIIAQNGGELIIHKLSSSVFDFCAYSILNGRSDGLTSWYCIDDTGSKCYVTVNPSKDCNQNSFTCSCEF